MRRTSLGWLPGLCLAYLVGAPAHAATFSTDTFFAANDRSVWTSGAGFTFDTGPRFLGAQWDIGKIVGGVTEKCILFACASFGAELGAGTSGKLGIDYSLLVNSGTFNVQLPGRATFTTPDTTSSVSGTPLSITLGSAYNTLPGLTVPTSANGPGVFRAPSLQVTGPNAQATLGLEAKVNAFAGARACFVLCYTEGLGPVGFDYSRSIATVNVNNDHTVTVLGNSVSANQSVSALGGLLNASVNIPNLNSSSQSTPNGFDGTSLTATKRDNIAVVNANVAQIAADAAGFPIPLSGNLGGFGYNILQANAGAALDVQQSISVTPKVSGSYLFSAPVTPVINGVDGAPTTRIDFNFGDNVTFKPGAVGKLSYIPVVNLDGVVRNETDLVVGGNLDIKALGLDIAGLQLGPLIDTQLASTDLGRIPLYDQTFTDHLGSITAAPITFDFAGCTTPVNVKNGEFISTFNFLCASSGYSPYGPYSAGDGSIYNLITQTDCAPAFPGTTPACTSFYPLGLVTSPYIPGSRSIYLGGPDPLAYRSIATTPSTTDAGQLISLASLGYTGAPSPFLIPSGTSFDMIVDEPAPFGILATALLGTLALRHGGPKRRRDRHMTITH